VAPTVIMLIGLFGNFIGQAIKGFSIFNNFFNRLRGGGKDLQHLAGEELDAAAAAASLEGKTTSLTAALNVQRSAVGQLARAYGTYVGAANSAATGLPQAFRGRPAKGMATGGMVGGRGNKDTEPALLTPGEFVINADSSKEFAPLLTAINEGKVGKYAEGRTRGSSSSVGFGDLGEVELASVWDQKSLSAIREMADSLSSASDDVRLEFKGILTNLAETQNVTKAMVQEVARDNQFEEIDALGAEKRYSVPKPIRDQSESLMAKRSTAVELERDAIREAMSKYGEASGYDLTESQMNNLTQTQASHLIPEITAQGEKINRPENLTPDLGAVNNYLNRIKNMEIDTDTIDQLVANINGDARNIETNAKEVAEELAKLKTGIHPITVNAQQVAGALGKMDAELSLAALNAGETRTSLNTIAATGHQGAAIGAVMDVRDKKKFSESIGERTYTGGSFIGARAVTDEAALAANIFNETLSEDIAENDPTGRGLANESGRGSPHRQAKQNAKEDGNAYVQTYSETVESGMRKRRGASRPQGPSGVSTSVLMSQMEEERIAQGQARRGSRGRVTREGDLEKRERLLALRPGEESSRIKDIDNARSLAMQEEVSRSHDLAIAENEKLTKQTSEVSKEMSKTKGYAKKFGGALKGGSLKLTGAMFAMDGVVFAASMMNNSMGEFAQKIMPAVFAVQGIAMMLPMMMAVLANPVGLVALGLIATTAAVWKINDMSNNVVEKGARLSDAMMGTAKAAEGMAEFFGSQTKTQELAAIKAQEASGAKIGERSLSQAQEYMQSESGKKLIEDYNFIKENLGSGKAAQGFANQIQRAIVSGAIGPKMGIAIAAAASTELGDMNLATDVSAQIKEYVGLDGEKINSSEGRLRIYANIFADAADIQRSAAEASSIWAKEWWGGQVSMILTGRGTSDIVAQNLSAALVNGQSAIADQLAANELAYRKNEISARQYLKINNQILESAKEQGLTWEGVKSKFEAAYPNMKDQTDIILQNVIDPFLDNMKVSLGESVADGLFEGFNNFKPTEVIPGMQVDLLNPQNVRDNLDRIQGALDYRQEKFNNSSNFAEQTGLKSEIDALEKAREELQNVQSGTMTVALAIQSQQLSPESLAKLLKDRSVSEVMLQLGSMPDALSSQFLSLAESLGGSGNVLDIGMNLSIAGNIEGLERLLLATTNIGKTTLDPNKIVNSNTARIINTTADSMNRYQKEIDGLNKKELKSKTLNFFSNGYGVTKANADWFLSLDPDQQRTFTTVYRTVIARPQNAQTIAPGSSAAGGLGEDEEGARIFAKIIADAGTVLNPKIEDTPTLTPDGDKDKDGGGSKTRSWLEDLIAETEANLQMFPKMLDNIKKKFPAIPQQIIEAIGGGEEGMKRAQELLNANKKKVKELLAKYRKATIAETLRGVQDEIAAKKKSKSAESMLLQQDFSKEDAKDLASNAEYAFAITEAAAGRGGKSVEEVVSAFRKLIAVTKEAKDPIDELNAAWSDYSNAVDMAFDVERTRVENEFAEKRYGAEQKTTKQIQEQVDLNEDLIQIQQDMIDKKQEEIDDYERINDLTSQNIDDLQRQDEIRNRVSDALSHELDLMSQQETKISEAYDKRIGALDKVQELNDRILQQQKDQLGVSQALSEGDIYAATAAAQAMRQNQIKDAQDQARAGLEQGKENAIESLRTSQGLTREEAEKQIADIKEQSYQASLMIRIEEDKIYANSLEVRRLTNEIYNINEDMIEPLTNQNNQYSRILESHQKALDVALSNLTVGKLTADEFQRQKDNQAALVASISANITKVNEYKAAWEAAANAARAANAEAASIPASAANNSSWSAVGGRPVFANAGGMVMRYSKGGNVLGDGSRDSVSAMLTPGEYVIRKAMVDKYGTPMFDAVNQGSYSMPKFNTSARSETKVSGSERSGANIVAPMYNNYSVSVNVSGSNASADEIANKTIMKIKQMQGTQIRSGRGY
jgi:hypothetical protein